MRSEANKIKRPSKRFSTLNKQPNFSPNPSLNHNHNSKNDNNNLHDLQARRSVWPETNLKETDKMAKVAKVAQVDKMPKVPKTDKVAKVKQAHLF